jgi:hypothetical protein
MPRPQGYARRGQTELPAGSERGATSPLNFDVRHGGGIYKYRAASLLQRRIAHVMCIVAVLAAPKEPGGVIRILVNGHGLTADEMKTRRHVAQG